MPMSLLERALVLPSVPYVDRCKSLPDRPGLYFLVSDSEVLYIGLSRKSIRSRWKTWHQAAGEVSRRSLEHDLRVAFVVYGDTSSLVSDEKAIIRELRPEWNSQHVPGAMERQQQRAAEACEWIDCDEHWHHKWPSLKPPTKNRPCVCIVHASCGKED